MKLRVCYFGTYRAEYNRNQIMIEGLRRAGVEVVECHSRLWTGIEDRVQAVIGGWARPRFLLRVLRAYLELLRKYRAVGDYDVMVVGYPGQFDVYLARLLAWLRRKPLVWDVLMSIYLVALERGLDKLGGFSVWVVRQVERLACRLPELLIIDTEAHRDWFCRTHGVKPAKFRLVPIGADDRVFTAQGNPQAGADGFRVMYYGSFLPNHGVEHIVEAARLLAEEATICFVLIGEGPEREKALRLARSYGLSNITFVPWLQKPELIAQVARGDVLLGVFGSTPLSQMTIHNKIYEGLAMARPIITGDSPAVRELLKHEHHLYLSRRADPRALAEAILVLRRDLGLRQRLAREGNGLFREQLDLLHIGESFAAHLQETAKSAYASS